MANKRNKEFVFPIVEDNPSREVRIVDKLLAYKKKYGSIQGIAFTSDSKAERLVKEDWNAFLFAVIFDQQIKAGQAWSKPLELKHRLGINGNKWDSAL